MMFRSVSFFTFAPLSKDLRDVTKGKPLTLTKWWLKQYLEASGDGIKGVDG
jgi:hypothetical protein